MRRPIDFVRWFMPGLGVKRWLVIAVFGAVLFVNGASRWLTDEGAHVGVNELVDWMVGDFFPPADLSYVFLVLGLVLVSLGIWRWLNSIVSAVRPYERSVSMKKSYFSCRAKPLNSLSAM